MINKESKIEKICNKTRGLAIPALGFILYGTLLFGSSISITYLDSKIHPPKKQITSTNLKSMYEQNMEYLKNNPQIVGFTY